MHILRAVILLVLIVQPSLADERGFKTGPWMNGRGWNSLAEHEQTYYVIGLVDGVGFSSMICDSDKLDQLGWLKATYGEMRAGITRFYSDPANTWVPVVYALDVFRMKLEGVAAEEIEKRTEEVRRLALKLREER